MRDELRIWDAGSGEAGLLAEMQPVRTPAELHTHKA